MATTEIYTYGHTLSLHDALPILQLDASAQWQEGRVTAEGQLGGAEIAAARFSADAPLRMTVDGAIELPPEQPVAGRLDWSGDIKTRSEEHTSELQSLMRISYAVFCLKKKTFSHIHNLFYT